MPTKFENMIMDQYVQTAYGPADDFTQMGTEMAGGTEPAGATPMTLKEFATSAADVPAGLLKGAVQGTLGIAGDIESIVYGVRELFKRGADESRLDAFLRGLGEGTVMPTTEDVKKWMDTNVGPLVPAGASERRREAAKIPEFVGELGGAGQTVIEGSRAAARGAKQIGREIATEPPTGAISGATRDVIRSSADDLTNQLNELGFQATVQHSGSRAGPSSYVEIYDPQTGRMFTKPVRFSGHGKGPREAAGVIEVQDPAEDIPKIVEIALQMRQQGPSKVFQRQAIVDGLIAGGTKPKQAYKEADKIIFDMEVK